MEYIIESLVEKAQELGFNITSRDIIFDDSRAYGLYVYADAVGLGHACRKFGAWRDYLGGGVRGRIENSSQFADDEKLKALGQLFEETLLNIENYIIEETNQERDEYPWDY